MRRVLVPPQLRHPEFVSGSFVRLAPPNRGQTQPHRQINPMRIFGVDQVDFRRPMPVLQLLLARNGSFHRAKKFKMHQAVNCIFGSMARRQMPAILRQPFQQVGCYANAKSAVKLARKDMNARLLFLSHQRSFAVKWTLKQVKGGGMENG